MILERGALLNTRYRIVEILGQGGMGSVYRAVDENLGMEVAVKDNLFTTEEYARQFRREAVILANLRHPNLPRVTDHFVIDGQGQYLVMDFIEGEDLRQRMDRVGIIEEEEAIIIGAAICDALLYLHTRKPVIVHRDIKPGNVKITPQGQIFLVDFGLAKTIQGSQATTTGARAMTPGYSPPEQYGTARTDHRSDIFSLGATLYAAVTGAVPEDALARAMDQVDLTPIRKHNPRISRRLSNALEKALVVRPDERFQTADEFKQALLSARSPSRRRNGELTVPPPPNLGDRPLPIDDGLPPTPGSTPSPARFSSEQPSPLPVSTYLDEPDIVLPRSRPRRKKLGWSCLLPILLVLLLFTGGAVATFLYQPGLLAPVLGGLPVSWLGAIATPTATAPAGGSNVLPAVSNTHNSTLIAIESNTTSTPTQAATSTPQPSATAVLQPTELPTPAATPTLVPTPWGGAGGEVAFASNRSGPIQVFISNLDGSNIRQVTDMPEGACQPSWSPDGLRLVFISPCEANRDFYPGSAMFIINADGSGLMPLPTVLGGDFDPAWSPDGTRIAFTSLRSSGRDEIYVLTLADNSVAGLSEKYSRDLQPAWSPDSQKIVFISTRKGPYQIWIMDADGQNQSLFSRSKDLVNLHPSFSPDGKQILFTQMVAMGGIPRLVVSPILPDQPYAEYRLTTNQIPMREGLYSPDGYWIMFEGWPAGSNHDIYTMASNGAGRQNVTSDVYLDFDPVWKPFP